MTRKKLKADICVIGAGSGGLSVASGGAQLGLKVVLFERGEMGGDCLNHGCVPSKALISAAARAHGASKSSHGVGAARPQVDWQGVKAHVRSVIEEIAPIDSQERFEGLGATVIRESAAFAAPNRVESESVEVTAARIVIAAGGRPRAPSIPGLAETPYFTNETIFTAPTFPTRLIVLGAGPIGVELGQAFRRLGAEVAIVDAGPALGRIDRDAAKLVLEALVGEGVLLRERVKILAARRQGDGVAIDIETADGAETIEGSHLLVAAGREPALSGLALEKGGVAFTERGVTTKANLRSVSNPRVWAVGDIAGREQFTHVAGWHASVFVRNALFKTPAAASAAAIPSCVYCDPEVAQIGLSAAAAKEKFGARASVARVPFHDNDRAQAEGDTRGFAEIVVGPGGALLGSTIVGKGAGDLIQIVAFAMANKQGVRSLTNYVAPYPTRGEILKRCASVHFTPVVFGAGAKRLVGVLKNVP